MPGMAPTMLVMFTARLPFSAMGVTMTLHVLTDLGRSYAAAGLVGATTMLGSAMGGPLVGRMLDRYGLRPIVALCGTASATYWISVPHLPYPVLLAIGVPVGFLAMPVGSVAKQVIAALVPQTHRRTAYSLDAISLESSFMIGPAVSIVLATQFSSTVALTAVGTAFGLTALAIIWVNPPIRHDKQPRANRGLQPRLRDWITPRLVTALLIAASANFVLSGMELSALAALRESGEVAWTGVVLAVMVVASLIGGLLHGGVKRSLSQLPLMLALAVLTIPIGLLDHPWWLLAIALIPANLACAPTLAASTETMSAEAPERVRGEAMGMQDLASRLGITLGNPLVGLLIDHSNAAIGFVGAGMGGLLFAASGILVHHWMSSRLRCRPPAPTTTAAQ
jgi:MFS family permease